MHPFHQQKAARESKHTHHLYFMWFPSNDSVERVVQSIMYCLSTLHVTNPNAIVVIRSSSHRQNGDLQTKKCLEPYKDLVAESGLGYPSM